MTILLRARSAVGRPVVTLDGEELALVRDVVFSDTEAVVTGFGGGLFRKAPFGVLVERGRAGRMQGADLQRLRRELGLRPARIG